ncbi:MAG: hypothetical protein K0Q94_4096 [Paenibacillus sp.]|nr:hypothetical protein [Paenibacillus sp.]
MSEDQHFTGSQLQDGQDGEGRTRNEEGSRTISRRALIAGLGAGGMLAAGSLYLGSVYGTSVTESVYGSEGECCGMKLMGHFRAGVEIGSAEQILEFAEADGCRITGYRWTGTLPHTTVSGSPSEDGGIGEGAWAAVYERGVGEALGDSGIYEYARVKPVPPAGQIANESEVIIPYRGALYCLFKGSYSLADQSYICVVRPTGDNELKVVSQIELGVGADARAMTIHNDDLFVFTGGKIKVYRIIDASLQFKLEYTRKYSGFVQSCRIINGRLYACNWGAGKIDRYDLVNGVPSRETQFSAGAAGNASIVSYGSVHYLITHTDTNNVTRLDIDQNGDVFARGVYSFPGVVKPRYAAIYNGIMTLGGYSTLYAKTVALDISSGTPVKIGEYLNMATHVRVGDYLIGTSYDQTSPLYSAYYHKLVKVSVKDGSIEVLSDRALLYPLLYRSTVFGFLLGRDGKHPAGHAGDSQLGQEIVCYSTSAIPKGIDLPLDAESYVHQDGIRYTGVKNMAAGDVIARFQSFSPARLGWLRLHVSYTIVDTQNVPGQTVTAQRVYTAFKASNGSWTMTLPRVDVAQAGALAVSLDFVVSGADAYVSCSGALTNALVTLSLDYHLTDNNMGSFYLV